MKGFTMNVAEIFIAHVLYGNPGMLHVTPDHLKIYFILKNRLVYIPAEKGTSFKGLDEEALNRIVQENILELMKSH